jgi:hypothetical protein
MALSDRAIAEFCASPDPYLRELGTYARGRRLQENEHIRDTGDHVEPVLDTAEPDLVALGAEMGRQLGAIVREARARRDPPQPTTDVMTLRLPNATATALVESRVRVTRYGPVLATPTCEPELATLAAGMAREIGITFGGVIVTRENVRGYTGAGDSRGAAWVTDIPYPVVIIQTGLSVRETERVAGATVGAVQHALAHELCHVVYPGWTCTTCATAAKYWVVRGVTPNPRSPWAEPFNI